MNSPFSACLHSWQCFYGLTGEVAGTLIGLMFIAMSLGNRRLTEDPLAVSSGQMLSAVQTFLAPTLIHLSSVVVIAAVISMPIGSPAFLSLCLGLIGLAGVIYGGITFRRLRHHAKEKDLGTQHWLFHFYLPCLCYATTLGTAILLFQTQDVLFALAVSMLLFLAVGIQNSWSATLHITGLTASKKR